MTTEIIKTFNEILDSLLIQVSPLTGSTISHKFQQVIKYNSIIPIEQFLVHALPLRDKIINRDDTYFLIKTDEDKINIENYWKETVNLKEKVLHNNDQVNCEKYTRTINEILRFQNIYENLDTDSKTNIWNIFNALLALGEEYIKIKYIK